MRASLAAIAAAAAAALVAVATTASLAHASPAADAADASAATAAATAAAAAAADTPDAAPRAPGAPAADDGDIRAYLEPGVELGATQGTFYGALQLDGGYHLGSTPFWLHGRFAQGALALIDDRTMSSDFTEARLGLEARGCALDGIACLVGGVDFGYRHEMLATRHDTDTTNLALAIARLGLDLGGKHLRLRPSIETSVHQGGWNGLGLTAGIAYTW